MVDKEYEHLCTFATLPRTIRGLPLVLTASPDGKQFVYCNGNSVIIRDVENPDRCRIYTEHSTLTTVACFSPSGFYVASGDQSGKVRIWDATQETHLLKSEYPVISGPVRDIAWSEDSKRMAVVGEGRERFGHVFLFDTGTSNGNLSGQSRSMSSIHFRPCRPYRIVSGSEDNTVAIFQGPPFKFTTLFHQHSRFVHCVRYRPDGSMFASAGADGKVVLFEGDQGQVQGELVDSCCKGGGAHDGGVFALCWSPDGRKLATVSGDKTCKVWDGDSRQLDKTFHMGASIVDQQLGCLWTPFALLSVSLAGFVHYFHWEGVDEKPFKVLKGHNKPITAMALSGDKGTLFTGDFEGNITRWNLSTGDSDRLNPAIHKSQISGLSVNADGLLSSVAWDDTVVFTADILGPIDSSGPTDSTKLPSQPRGVSISNDGKIAVIACQKSVCLFENGRLKVSSVVSFESTCIDLSPDKKLIVVGGQDNKARVFEWTTGDSLKMVKELSHTGVITAVGWSPDGQFVAVSDGARKVVPYRVNDDFKVASENDWTFHSAKVNCLAWSPDSSRIATGGLDTNIIVWDMCNTKEHPVIVKGAHAMSQVNGVAWLSNDMVVSVGQDSNVKQWRLIR